MNRQNVLKQLFFVGAHLNSLINSSSPINFSFSFVPFVWLALQDDGKMRLTLARRYVDSNDERSKISDPAKVTKENGFESWKEF
jgi:hypothetical protein